MNELDRRVATLAALFAPERAAALLARLAGGGADAATHAERVAALPRQERLQALTAILADDPVANRAAACAAAAMERLPVSAVLRALGNDAADPGAAPALLRLCRERIAR